MVPVPGFPSFNQPPWHRTCRRSGCGSAPAARAPTIIAAMPMAPAQAERTAAASSHGCCREHEGKHAQDPVRMSHRLDLRISGAASASSDGSLWTANLFWLERGVDDAVKLQPPHALRRVPSTSIIRVAGLGVGLRASVFPGCGSSCWSLRLSLITCMDEAISCIPPVRRAASSHGPSSNSSPISLIWLTIQSSRPGVAKVRDVKRTRRASRHPWVALRPGAW